MSSSLAGNNPRVNSMFSQMMEITKDPEFKNASPDVQQMLLFGGVLGSQPSQIPTQEELDRMGGFQQEQARFAQELGKESVKKAFQKVRTQVALLNAFLQEHITGMRLVQIFGAEQQEFDKFNKINEHHKEANIEAVWAYSIFFPVVEILLAAITNSF